MTNIEHRLREAFGEARATTNASPDLFARVQRSLEDDLARRRWRWVMTRRVLAFIGSLVLVAVIFGDNQNGRFTMPWWLIEVLTNIVLVAIAVVLGPFIKRFGRSYAADVFRANPQTGKSYLVLTDVAYYLIFTAFVLFTLTFKDLWAFERADQWRHEVARIGGILLIMGILHAANVVALPVIGKMLSSHGLESRAPQAPPTPPHYQPSTLAGPSLTPGTWIVRVEVAPDTADTSAPPLPPPVGGS